MFGLFEDFTEQGLTNHWSMDETTGTGAVVIDRRGAFTGTTFNTENGDWSAGKIGNAITLDGVNERVLALGSASSFSTGDFTFACWAFPTALVNETLMHVGPAGNDPIILRVVSSNFDATVDETEVLGSTTISDAGFTHFGLTREGSALTTYVNGTPENTGTDGSTLDLGTEGLNIGSLIITVPTNFFQGQLDDVRVYNRGLSAAEMGGLATIGFA